MSNSGQAPNFRLAKKLHPHKTDSTKKDVPRIEQEPMPNTSSKPKGFPAATVAKARELVSYQDGAVVSREIVKKPTGNVTLFAFDEGQGLSEHTAPFDALVQVIEGDAEITISGQPRRVQGGEMVLMPAGQPHASKRSSGSR